MKAADFPISVRTLKAALCEVLFPFRNWMCDACNNPAYVGENPAKEIDSCEISKGFKKAKVCHFAFKA